jgi:hypothetical protein
LDPLQRDGFERQLEQDQVAREALAAAVTLEGALRAAGADHERRSAAGSSAAWAQPAAAFQRPFWRRSLIALAALSACLAVALLPAPQQPQPAATQAAADSPLQDDLAQLWATQLDQLPAPEPWESAAAAETVAEPEPVVWLQPPTAPGWMAAALDQAPADEDPLEESL